MQRSNPSSPTTNCASDDCVWQRTQKEHASWWWRPLTFTDGSLLGISTLHVAQMRGPFITSIADDGALVSIDLARGSGTVWVAAEGGGARGRSLTMLPCSDDAWPPFGVGGGGGTAPPPCSAFTRVPGPWLGVGGGGGAAPESSVATFRAFGLTLGFGRSIEAFGAVRAGGGGSAPWSTGRLPFSLHAWHIGNIAPPSSNEKGMSPELSDVLQSVQQKHAS